MATSLKGSIISSTTDTVRRKKMITVLGCMEKEVCKIVG